MMKKNTAKKITGIVCGALVTVLVLALLQRLVMPKYMSDVLEGGMIAEYYDERKDHDVVFIGDCEVYENFSPKVLWEKYGINSYIRGSAEQLVWQSYYLCEETLKYEKPKAIVFNVLAMEFNEPQKEEYNRMTLDNMKWSTSKIKSIKASMTGKEHFIEYVFPILRFHSRITELENEDFYYFFDKPDVTHNGYYMRVDVKPAENIPEPRSLSDYNFGENAYHYLDMMRELCEREGVELILIKAPSLYPYWYPQWDEQMKGYAEKYGLRYYNFLENIDEIGLDFSLDTYDSGLHLNLSGAEKLSDYFGNILQNECGISSRKDDSTLSKEWEKKIKAYDREIELQYDRMRKGEDVK